MVMLKKIVVPVLLLIGILVVSVAYGWWVLNRPNALNEEIVFTISPGEAMGSITHRIKEIGLFPYPDMLQLYGRLFGFDRYIQVGEYKIEPQTSALSFLSKLVSGDVILYSVTLVEGRTFRENLAALDNEKLQDNEIQNLSSKKIMSELNLIDVNPEGMFFPDTYFFRGGESSFSILKRSHKRMQETLEEEWEQRAAGLPYKNPYEAVIMASLVERETSVSEERSTIAGVFIKRLQKGMRLQTDPTVIYGLGDKFQGKLSRKHLRQSTPYNTYVHKGLPPTPISLIGRAALKAALQPEQNDYLYFVARGDGYHHFSKTLDDHNAAVKKYQLSRRQDYRSFPAN